MATRRRRDSLDGHVIAEAFQRFDRPFAFALLLSRADIGSVQYACKKLHPLIYVRIRNKGLMDPRGHDVPFTTQTRLNFDVIFPLWGRRGPQ